MKKFLLGGACVLSIASAASAMPANRTWYETRDWKVWQEFTDKGPVCQIQTFTPTDKGPAWVGMGANMRIKTINFMYGEPHWHWNSDQPTFHIQVDNHESRTITMWQSPTMSGVLGTQLNGEPAVQFINELQAGSRLVIHTGSGDREFSLVNSKGAIAAMNGCIGEGNGIESNPADHPVEHLPRAVQTTPQTHVQTLPRATHPTVPHVATSVPTPTTTPAPSAASIAKQLN